MINTIAYINIEKERLLPGVDQNGERDEYESNQKIDGIFNQVLIKESVFQA